MKLELDRWEFFLLYVHQLQGEFIDMFLDLVCSVYSSVEVLHFVWC